MTACEFLACACRERKYFLRRDLRAEKISFLERLRRKWWSRRGSTASAEEEICGEAMLAGDSSLTVLPSGTYGCLGKEGRFESIIKKSSSSIGYADPALLKLGSWRDRETQVIRLDLENININSRGYRWYSTEDRKDMYLLTRVSGWSGSERFLYLDPGPEIPVQASANPPPFATVSSCPSSSPMTSMTAPKK